MKNPHVHIVRNMKHNNNHQIEEHTHIDNGVHLVCVTSPGPGVKSGEVISLMLQDDDEYMVYSFSLQGK